MSDYTDNVQRVNKGIMIDFIQATGEKGDIEIEFRSPWLRDTKCTVKAN